MRYALRMYRLLLKLYPARFREEYEGPLERQFRDDYQDTRGFQALAVFFIRALCDLALSIPVQLARELTQDVRHALRMYRQRSVITGLAALALTLAVGATTGIFSVLNAVLLRSLPFREADRLVYDPNPVSWAPRSITPGGFDAWSHSIAYLEDAAQYRPANVNLNSGRESVRVKAAEVTANFFDLLGAIPAAGRSLRSEESVAGRDQVAVVGYGLWQGLFGGDPRRLGATIRLNGTPFTIIGVAPPGFDFPSGSAVWTPTIFDYSRVPTGIKIMKGDTVGRLRPGLSLKAAEALHQAQFRRYGPRGGRDCDPLVSLRDQLAGRVRNASLALFAVVAFVLLIACANVAQLLLSRVTERRQELAVRSALGASRARLIQQLITEALLLTLGAGLAGLLVAHWAARLAGLVEPAALATQKYAILDWRVLAFAVGAAVLTGVVFGALPAWLIGRMQPDWLRSRGTQQGADVRRMRAGLVALQAALTLALAAGSVSMGRSFLNLIGTGLGFLPQHLATATVSMFGTPYWPNNGSKVDSRYYDAALERVRAMPGVEAAGAAEYIPLTREQLFGLGYQLETGPKDDAVVIAITPGYLGAMGVQILQGRDFTPADKADADRVAIVSEDLARSVGAGSSVVGRRLRLLDEDENAPPLTIVGVARAAVYRPGRRGLSSIYIPLKQDAPVFATFVARVRGDPESFLPAMREALRDVDRGVPVYDVETLEARLGQTLAKPRFYVTAVLFFCAFALLLSIVGVYGVAAHSIAQRTHEIGVRIALGAETREVRGMLLRQSLVPVAVGMAAGVAAALGSSRVLVHLMEKAEPVSAWTCFVGVLVLGASAGAAAWSASRQIARMDPVRALRAE